MSNATITVKTVDAKVTVTAKVTNGDPIPRYGYTRFLVPSSIKVTYAGEALPDPTVDGHTAYAWPTSYVTVIGTILKDQPDGGEPVQQASSASWEAFDGLLPYDDIPQWVLDAVESLRPASVGVQPPALAAPEQAPEEAPAE